MKKHFIKFIFVFAFACLISNEKVLANELDDLSITATVDGKVLKVSLDDNIDESASYFVKFVNENDGKPDNIPSNLSNVPTGFTDTADIKKWKATSNGVISISNNWYLYDGYNYAYILKCDSSACIINDNAIHINKPNLPNLGERYTYKFVTGELNLLANFPHEAILDENTGKYINHNVKVKIGLIDDIDLLKSLSKNESNSLNKLVDYAKKNDGSEFELLLGDSIDIGSYKVTQGAYYYVYIDIEDASGTYRNLEDISIVMGRNSGTGQAWLDNNVVWNFDEEVEETTVKNPNTGIVIGISGLFIVIISLLIMKKKNKFSRV